MIPKEIQACVFDLDGVITDTASVHAAAWTRIWWVLPVAGSACQASWMSVRMAKPAAFTPARMRRPGLR